MPESWIGRTWTGRIRAHKLVRADIVPKQGQDENQIYYHPGKQSHQTPGYADGAESMFVAGFLLIPRLMSDVTNPGHLLPLKVTLLEVCFYSSYALCSHTSNQGRFKFST